MSANISCLSYQSIRHTLSLRNIGIDLQSTRTRPILMIILCKFEPKSPFQQVWFKMGERGYILMTDFIWNNNVEKRAKLFSWDTIELMKDEGEFLSRYSLSKIHFWFLVKLLSILVSTHNCALVIRSLDKIYIDGLLHRLQSNAFSRALQDYLSWIFCASKVANLPQSTDLCSFLLSILQDTARAIIRNLNPSDLLQHTLNNKIEASWVFFPWHFVL